MKKLFTLAVGLVALLHANAQVQRSERSDIINGQYGNNLVPTSVNYQTPFLPGENRYIAFIYMAEFNQALSYPTAISFNGVTATKIGGTENDLTDKAVVQIWAISEAQLATGNGGAGTLANTNYPVNITWNTRGSGQYLLSAISFRYASQTSGIPNTIRVNQGNNTDSMMLGVASVKGGDLIFHFSMFTRDQVNTIVIADSPNTKPVATNAFLGSPVLNQKMPTGAAKQFVATTWSGAAPLNTPTTTYIPTFVRTTTENPTKWIVSGAKVPYVEFTKPVSGKVWIDADGNGSQNGLEAAPQNVSAEYQVVAISRSGATNDPFNGKVRYVFPISADGSWSGNVNSEYLNDGTISVPNYKAPKYEFALVKKSEVGGGLSESQTAPANLGDNTMGAAPQSNTAYYVHATNAGSLPMNANGTSTYFEPATNAANGVGIKMGIQSRPFSNDQTGDAGFLKGKQFISLAAWPLSGVDGEDGQMGNGKRLRILTLPAVKNGVTIKLAYDKNNNGIDASDLITSVPYDITSYDETKLYAYYESGDGNYSGEFFQFTFVDAAGVGSQSNNTLPVIPGNQMDGGLNPLGSGTDGAAVFNFDAILPVGGIELAGTYNGGKASLRWKLNGTDDVARYELERGNNAAGFRTVATMSANGREYNHVDDLSAFTGSDAFYRVKLVRTNGAVSYSNVISLKLATITGLQLMPTIVQSNLQVRFNNTRSQDVTIRVMNISGQAVMTQTSKLSAGNASISLNGFERLTNGTYSVQVFAGTTVTQGKIVVQH